MRTRAFVHVRQVENCIFDRVCDAQLAVAPTERVAVPCAVMHSQSYVPARTGPERPRARAPALDDAFMDSAGCCALRLHPKLVGPHECNPGTVRRDHRCGGTRCMQAYGRRCMQTSLCEKAPSVASIEPAALVTASPTTKHLNRAIHSIHSCVRFGPTYDDVGC